MKKTLLVTAFSAAMAICVTATLTTTFATRATAQQQPQSGSALQEIIAQQRKAELASKYGLTQAQIDQFEELQRQSEGKYAEINNSQIPAKERGQKVGEVKRAFQVQVKDVMTPEQYDRWLADRQQEDAALTKLRNDRFAKLKQIEASSVPESQKADERKAMEAAFQTAVKNLLGEARGTDAIERLAGAGEWHKNNNKGLTLTRTEANQLAAANRDKEQQRAAVEARNLTRREERAALESIKSANNTEVRQALGDPKYAVWAKNNANRLNRYLSKNYNMTADQISKYKTLLNDQQVAKLQLAQATMASDEKAAKREEIDRQYNEKLQQILSPQQYGKVVQDDNYRQQKQAEKRAKIGPRPVQQGAPQSASQGEK